jgi:GNAT superfamily N-acetyltransferase
MMNSPASNKSGSAGTAAPRNWVPVRSLGPRHRGRIATHLLGLSESDRYLRFGHAATDGQIQKYVDMLDFDRDEIFGIFNRRLDLIALAHLAFGMDETGGGRPQNAEFGVSVAAASRGRGFGQRLFEHAMLHARNRGVKTLLVHALSENTAMLRIARNLGAKIVRDGSESEARVALPADNLASHLDAIVADQAAEVDYQLKLQSKNVARVLDIVSEVRAQIGAHSHVGEE